MSPCVCLECVYKCVCEGEASWMGLVLGYRRHGVVFCSMTVSDQLRGRVGEKVMKEMEWMRREEIAEH